MNLIHHLSTPSTSISACDELVARVKNGECKVSELVQFDCIPPLLKIIQDEADSSDRRDVSADVAAIESSSSSSSTATTTTTAAAAAAAAAHRLLSLLLIESHSRLLASGWRTEVDNRTGRVRYCELASGGRTQFVPPPVVMHSSSTTSSTSLTSTSSTTTITEEPEWVTCLLTELPLLVSPLISPDDEVKQWPVRIRFHQPSSFSSEDSTSAAVAVSVIDVRPELECGGVDSTTIPSGDPSPSSDGTTRHLILGPYQGIACAFRESETDLSYEFGEHLENWYTCTMAAVALVIEAEWRRRWSEMNSSTAATASSSFAASSSSASSSSLSPPSPLRLLLIGLGGGSLVSFLQYYSSPHTIDITVVELNATVVKVAKDWFSVRVKGEKDATDTTTTGGVRIHVTDASTFLASAPSSSYDIILLDVYTSGVFPPSLLTSDFFHHCHRVLSSASSSTDSEGNLLINAGIGTDRSRVFELTQQVFGVERTRLLLDQREKVEIRKDVMKENDSAAAAADRVSSAENGVLLCGPAASSLRQRLTTVEWRKHIVGTRDPELPPLPFELASVRTDRGDGSEGAVLGIAATAPSSSITSSADPSSSSTTPPIESHTSFSSLPAIRLTWRGVEFSRQAAREARLRTRLAKMKLANGGIPSVPKLASKEDPAWALFD